MVPTHPDHLVYTSPIYLPLRPVASVVLEAVAPHWWRRPRGLAAVVLGYTCLSTRLSTCLCMHTSIHVSIHRWSSKGPMAPAPWLRPHGSGPRLGGEVLSWGQTVAVSIVKPKCVGIVKPKCIADRHV